MAKCGVAYLVAALPSNAISGTYSDGFIVADVVSIKTSIDMNESTLYASNKLKESLRSFKGGKLTLEIDDLLEDVKAKILGHTVDDETKEITSNEDDVAPFYGVGFYGNTYRDGVWGFRALWFTKTQFSEPADDLTTKGESTTLGTTTLENTLYKDDKGDWKKEKFFTTEEEAIAWLNDKAGITTA